MNRISRAASDRYTANRAKRWAQPFTKRHFLQAARAMWPIIATLTFAGVAHAQGTMDFSGAQTLMGTFKTFAIFAKCVVVTVRMKYIRSVFAIVEMLAFQFPVLPRCFEL